MTDGPDGGAILEFGTPSNTASPDAPTMPDGEKDSTDGNRADQKPGDPLADPQNLAKDSQAVGGIVGTDSRGMGAASLGSQPGFVGTTEADVKSAVENAPAPEGEVRTSWAQSGDYDK